MNFGALQWILTQVLFLSHAGIHCSSYVPSPSGFGLASSRACPAAPQACSIGSSCLGWPNLKTSSFHHLLSQCVSCRPLSHPAGTLDIIPYSSSLYPINYRDLLISPSLQPTLTTIALGVIFTSLTWMSTSASWLAFQLLRLSPTIPHHYRPSESQTKPDPTAHSHWKYWGNALSSPTVAGGREKSDILLLHFPALPGWFPVHNSVTLNVMKLP